MRDLTSFWVGWGAPIAFGETMEECERVVELARDFRDGGAYRIVFAGDNMGSPFLVLGSTLRLLDRKDEPSAWPIPERTLHYSELDERVTKLRRFASRWKLEMTHPAQWWFGMYRPAPGG